MSLQEQVVIVTGAGQGIGRAMVKRFVAGGARVVAAARTQSHLDSLAAELPAGSVLPFAMDVRSYSEAEAMAAAARSRFGRIDVLVNNAGVGKYGPIDEVTPETWAWMVDVNLTGVFNCTKAVLPQLREQVAAATRFPAGQLLNVASVLGRNVTANKSVYSMTKAGLIHLTECWKQELEPDGIRVQLLAPGTTQTDFAGVPAASRAGGLKPETVAEVAWQMLTLPGDGTLGPVFLPPSPRPAHG